MKTKKNETTDLINNKSTEKVYFDFICLSFITSLFFIEYIKSKDSFDIMNLQFLYLTIVNIVASLFILFNKKIVSQNLFNIIQSQLLSKSYFSFLLLAGVSVCFANNFSESIVNFSRLLIVLMTIINLIFLLYDRLYLIYKISIIIGVSLFLISFFNLKELFNAKTILDGLTNLKGNTGNINIFSASILMKTPFALIGILYFNKWTKYFLILALIMGILCILLTGSRSALISLVFQIIVFAFFNFKLNGIKKNSIKNFTLVIFSLFLSFGISRLILNPITKTNENSRYESAFSRIKNISTNNTSETQRLNYWEGAIKLTKQNWLTGVCLGNYKIESIPLESKYYDINNLSIHPHNDFLEIFSETGVLNGFVYIFMFGLIFIQNIKKIYSSLSNDEKTISFLVLMLFVSYFIDSAFNFPLYRPPIQIGFSFIIALTIINSSRKVFTSIFLNNQKWNIIFIFVGVVCLFFSFTSFKADQLEKEIRFDIRLAQPKLTSDYIISKMPKFPNIGSSTVSFAGFAAEYMVKEHKYEDAVKYLDSSYSINPYLGYSHYFKSIIATNNRDFKKALIYSQIAFNSVPRNFEYYLKTTKDASNLKDTATILKTFYLASELKEDTLYYKNTAIALSISKYEKSKIINLLDSGLKKHPKNGMLLKLKEKIGNKKITFVNSDNSVKKNKLVQQQLDTKKAFDYQLEGKKLFDASKFDSALNSFNKAYELNPQNLEISEEIGICYFKLNEFNKAIEYLLIAINSPKNNNGKIEYVIGGCYINLKDTENGCKYLNLAKNKNYPNIDQFIKSYCK